MGQGLTAAAIQFAAARSTPLSHVAIGLPQRDTNFMASQGRVSERPLDDGIKHAVILLQQNGVETFESCEGGMGHAFPKPTIRFHGDSSEGFRVLALAQKNRLRVDQLRRYYQVQDGEPAGPYWEITFVKGALATCPRC